MFSAHLGLALVTSLVVHVDETVDVSPSDQQAIVAALASAIKDQTGLTASIDAARTADICSGNEICTAAVLSRTKSTEVVFLHLKGVASGTALKAERTAGGGAPPTKAELSLPRQRATWPSFLSGTAILLFPEGRNVTPPIGGAAPVASPGGPVSLPRIRHPDRKPPPKLESEKTPVAPPRPDPKPVVVPPPPPKPKPAPPKVEPPPAKVEVPPPAKVEVPPAPKVPPKKVAPPTAAPANVEGSAGIDAASAEAAATEAAASAKGIATDGAGAVEAGASEGELPMLVDDPPPSGADMVADTTTLAFEDGDEGGSVWPWVALGTAVVAGGVGAYFGVKNSDFIDQGQAEPDPVLRDAIQDDVFTTGLAANVLFGTAAVGAITSVVLFVME